MLPILSNESSPGISDPFASFKADAERSRELYDKSPLILSHSLREVAHNCPRKYEFTARYRPERKHTDNYAADVGTALHRGVQDYVLHRNRNRAIAVFMSSFPYDSEFTNDDPTSTTTPYAKMKRSFEASAGTLDVLLTSFDWDDYDLVYFTLGGVQYPGIEVSFAIHLINKLSDLPAYFMGHIDLVLRNRKTNELAVFDIKTTQNDLTPVRWEYDQQTTPYGLVLASLLGHEITNVTTHYLAAQIDLAKPQVIDFPIVSDEDRISDWVLSIADDLYRFYAYMLKGKWPRAISGSSCMSYKKPCAFFNLCKMRDPSLIYNMISRDQEDSFYNPEKALVKIDFDMGKFL